MEPGLPLHSVEQVRAIDREAIARLGIPAFELMHRAAAAALAHLRQRWPAARRLLVACGSGNNGGDGFVLARLAQEAGLHAQVVQAEAGAGATPEAQSARAGWLAESGAASVFTGELPSAELVVDALLGVGLHSAPRSAQAALIRAINQHPAPVLALDVPSGIDADSGHAPGECVAAEATLAFIVDKRGLHTGDACDAVGALAVARLGVPPEVVARQSPVAHAIARDHLAAVLPPRRRRGAHKGAFGHVLVVGGDHGMGGAASLAAQAAARCGAGLVSVATRERHVAALLAARPELMLHAVDAAGALDPLLERATVVAIGPGLGRDHWGRALLARVLGAGRPLVLDADALNLLAEAPASLPAGCVITPHPGEAARLLGSDVASVQRDRFAAAAALAGRFGAAVVLKGAGSLVAAPGAVPAVVAAGNPGMASGGMGDVLTGVVAALRAQGLGAFEAARAGALLHAAAGDLAAGTRERGLLAGDLLDAVRSLANPEPA